MKVILEGKEAKGYLEFRSNVENILRNITALMSELEDSTPSSLTLPSKHWRSRSGLRHQATNLIDILEGYETK